MLPTLFHGIFTHKHIASSCVCCCALWLKGKAPAIGVPEICWTHEHPDLDATLRSSRTRNGVWKLQKGDIIRFSEGEVPICNIHPNKKQLQHCICRGLILPGPHTSDSLLTWVTHPWVTHLQRAMVMGRSQSMPKLGCLASLKRPLFVFFFLQGKVAVNSFCLVQKQN